MSHRLPTQTDCGSGWLAAAKFVDDQKGHEAHNVLFDIANPTLGLAPFDPVVSKVEAFLNHLDKSVLSIANTIFPNGLYRRYRAPAFFDMFHETVLPRVRRNDRWSGYYFERMTAYPTLAGGPLNLLWNMVERIRDPNIRSLNKFEISLFDPERDIDNSPYGGQCLSFLSFHLLPGAEKKLTLTAMYRNHYYIEKLLGNLIGLGWLMSFVAEQGGVGIGHLTILSTHAKVDQPRNLKRKDVTALLKECSEAHTAREARVGREAELAARRLDPIALRRNRISS